MKQEGKEVKLSSALHIFGELNGGFSGELQCFGDMQEAKKTDLNPKVAFQNAREKNLLPRIYMSCGTEDGLLDANRSFKEFFEKEGADLTYTETPGAHEWDFWNRQIHEALEWMPLEKESQGMNSGHVTVD